MFVQVATKGHFSIAESGEMYRFMFNPNEMNDQHSVNYARQGVPGVSHPIIQFASGGERTISFELWLDGDRGRTRRGAINSLRSADTRENSLTIQDDLDFLYSLTLPVETEGRIFSDVHPPVILFTFGTMFEAMPCVLTSAPHKITKWDSRMNPIRGTVGITLEQKVSRSVKRDTVFVSGRST